MGRSKLKGSTKQNIFLELNKIEFNRKLKKEILNDDELNDELYIKTHFNYYKKIYSPIKIPLIAMSEYRYKKRGYYQVKYLWENKKFKYEVRWHTMTHNQPDKRITWVVERIRKCNKIVQYYTTNKHWINEEVIKKIYNKYINNTITSKEKQILESIHISAIKEDL